MRRSAFIVAALFVAWATAAGAAVDSAKPTTDQDINLSPVAVPIIVDGRLVNYVFVTVKVVLAPSVDQLAYRDKEPYFRDALVRAAHRTPFVLRYDYNHIDAARLISVMLREASAITGPNVVRTVVIVEQTPQHQVSSPRPGPPNPH